jgi:hypothetical protein
MPIPTVFRSTALPDDVAARVVPRLADAHRLTPFSPLDPRDATRRVAGICAEAGLTCTVIRGGVDLAGVEVDHVWLAVAPPGIAGGAWVVDAAFPLFADDFVTVLRGYVAGDAEAEDLLRIAAQAGLEHRVVGRFPAPVRYRGRPVWSARHASGTPSATNPGGTNLG